MTKCENINWLPLHLSRLYNQNSRIELNIIIQEKAWIYERSSKSEPKSESEEGNFFIAYPWGSDQAQDWSETESSRGYYTSREESKTSNARRNIILALHFSRENNCKYWRGEALSKKETRFTLSCRVLWGVIPFSFRFFAVSFWWETHVTRRWHGNMSESKKVCWTKQAVQKVKTSEVKKAQEDSKVKKKSWERQEHTEMTMVMRTSSDESWEQEWKETLKNYCITVLSLKTKMKEGILENTGEYTHEKGDTIRAECDSNTSPSVEILEIKRWQEETKIFSTSVLFCSVRETMHAWRHPFSLEYFSHLGRSLSSFPHLLCVSAFFLVLIFSNRIFLLSTDELRNTVQQSLAHSCTFPISLLLRLLGYTRERERNNVSDSKSKAEAQRTTQVK